MNFKVVFTLSLVGVVSLLAEVRAEEWKDLLPEGKLETHWKTAGNWSVDDHGVISLVPREGEKGWSRFDAYLWLNGDYDNFEIQFDYQLEPKGNSGFYFNVGDRSNPVKQGIEVQIYDSGSKPATAKLTDHDSGGVIPKIPPTRNAAKPAGEWNQFLIQVQGDKLTVKLNGEIVNEVNLNSPELGDRPDKGSIGFQDHALPLKLRNIKIREL